MDNLKIIHSKKVGPLWLRPGDTRSIDGVVTFPPYDGTVFVGDKVWFTADLGDHHVMGVYYLAQDVPAEPKTPRAWWDIWGWLQD